jgi:hypothetical protein
MTVDQAIALVFKWLKTASSLALGVFIALTLAKLFGLQILAVPSLGWQEFGVMVAGTAYAIRSL